MVAVLVVAECGVQWTSCEAPAAREIVDGQRRRCPGKRREVLKVQRRGPGDVQGVGVVGPGRRSRTGDPEPKFAKKLGF